MDICKTERKGFSAAYLSKEVSSQYFGKFPKFESRAFSCSTQTSEISPGFLKGYLRNGVGAYDLGDQI
jgi:hypothetical protein